MTEAELFATVSDWRDQDLDAETAARLEELLALARRGEPEALAELRSAFAGPLTFGTAGLRGPLGPGPARMNRVVVIQAAAGLAAYLADEGAAGGRVLIGYDARHNSARFATDTAEVMAAAGFEALLCPEPLPTPVIAFGIRHFGCVAAVVVTASHNPPQDNGYKVYLGDGSQIVPPADSAIAARIREAADRPLSSIRRSGGYRLLGDELSAAYVARVASLVDPAAPRQLTWVHTALHGVGTLVVEQVAAVADFSSPHIVESQAWPDPDFPTVGFPNPEEPGAIDLALELAAEIGADVAIANDPDADRCAVAVPGPLGWRMLTGDELGVLLADDAIASGRRGTLACSVVSSTMLAELASAAGLPFVTTLTGFKWIGRVPGLIFGYEEAIGYCTDAEAVRDKDGISAALRVLARVAQLKAEGSSLLTRLDELYRQFGLHLTSQLSFRVVDLALIGEAMARLRTAPPATLAHQQVSVIDLADGSPLLPPTDGLLLSGERIRVVVRPSGTEPKLKCYLQVALPVAESQDLQAARELAGELLAAARADMTLALGL